MGVEVVADLRVRQGVRTERLGVVSGEAGVLEVARDVQQEKELPVAVRQPGRLGGRADERDARPV
jgi:hypothetical protein